MFTRLLFFAELRELRTNVAIAIDSGALFPVTEVVGAASGIQVAMPRAAFRASGR